MPLLFPYTKPSIFDPHTEQHRHLERELVASLINEVTEMVGIPLLYLPATTQHVDNFLGEDRQALYNRSIPMRMISNSNGGWEAEEFMYNKFGITDTNNIQFKIVCSVFDEKIGREPQPGDIIWFGRQSENSDADFDNRFFEVSHVNNDEEVWYTYGTAMVYTIWAKTFVYSAENINTGNATLDSVNQLYDEMPANSDNAGIDQEAAGDVGNGIPGIVDFDENDPFSTLGE